MALVPLTPRVVSFKADPRNHSPVSFQGAFGTPPKNLFVLNKLKAKNFDTDPP